LLRKKEGKDDCPRCYRVGNEVKKGTGKILSPLRRGVGPAKKKGEKKKVGFLLPRDEMPGEIFASEWDGEEEPSL